MENVIKEDGSTWILQSLLLMELVYIAITIRLMLKMYAKYVIWQFFPISEEVNSGQN